ncbi:MAG: HAMP domain-containing protein, partial [Ignavibacteriales bacterium]
MKWFNNLALNKKFLALIISFGIILVLATMIFSIYQFSNFNFSKAESEASVAVNTLDFELTKYKERAEYFARIIALNSDVSAAVKDRNREFLIKKIKIMTEGTDIDFVTITDNNGDVIARTHEPEKFGDNISKQLNVKTALGGNQVSVIETGTVVKLSARSGAPVYDTENNLIGVISTGFALDKHEKLDDMKKLFDCEFTLFLGDVRINTTIIKEGKRLVGTKLDPKVAGIVLNESKEYYGEADILGNPYVTAYKPLLDNENKAMGVVFSGKPLKEIISARNSIIYAVVPVTAIVLIIAILFMNRFIRMMITNPVKELVTEGANKISVGEVDINIKSTRTDEIGDLQRAFVNLAENVKLQATSVEKISLGDLSMNIKPRSDKDILGNSIQKLSGTIKQLINETSELTNSALDGKLKVRGNASNFSGGYKEIVAGVNSTLDAVINPVKEGSDVLAVL